jgi:hypothetical protein
MLSPNLISNKQKHKISHCVQNVHGIWTSVKYFFSILLWDIFGSAWETRSEPLATEQEEIIEMEAWSARLEIPPSSEPRTLILRISEEFKDLKKNK